MADHHDITALLVELEGGNRTVVDQLLPHVYDELQVMAHRQLRGERSDHTLNTTALVHEAYIKLADQDQATWQNRAHFFGIAALAMRRILINYAHKRRAEKRGGGAVVATLVEGEVAKEARAEELIALDEALDRLAQLSERQAKIVELWFFGGLTQEEIAEVLDISVPTIRRDWRMARAWLSRELGDEAGAPPNA
ncbi:MAG: sigma-70 family RNA polymerase sigma factor [Rhodothermaceae bacterium]|nr:sigma-70 family RNA polymerase sigma factor [Rhodothermaceae bacterium]